MQSARTGPDAGEDLPGGAPRHRHRPRLNLPSFRFDDPGKPSYSRFCGVIVGERMAWARQNEAILLAEEAATTAASALASTGRPQLAASRKALAAGAAPVTSSSGRRWRWPRPLVRSVALARSLCSRNSGEARSEQWQRTWQSRRPGAHLFFGRNLGVVGACAAGRLVASRRASVPARFSSFFFGL